MMIYPHQVVRVSEEGIYNYEMLDEDEDFDLFLDEEFEEDDEEDFDLDEPEDFWRLK